MSHSAVSTRKDDNHSATGFGTDLAPGPKLQRRFFENLKNLFEESFYHWTTLNFELLAELVLQLEVYYKVNGLLNGLTAQQVGTTN